MTNPWVMIRLNKGRRLLRTGLWCSCVVLLTACGPQLRNAPNATDVDLSGDWRLQAPQRDLMLQRLHLVLQQAQAKQDRRERRGAPPQGGMDGEAPRDQAATAGNDTAGPGPGVMNGSDWERRDQQEQQQALANLVAPTQQLKIVQTSPQRIDMYPQAQAARHFDATERSTLVTGYATLIIRSGWQGTAFVVEARDAGQKLTIISRYERMTSDRMRIQVTLSMSGISDQKLEASYLLASSGES